MKYLAAVDLSEASLLALDALRALAKDETGDVTLLHVVDLDLYTAGGSVPAILEFARKRLTQEADRLSGCGLNDPSIRVEQGDSTQTILRVAAEEQADLIVMTNVGKGSRTGRVFGSTAERVAVHGNTPVLIERVGLAAGDGESCCRLIEGSPFERVLVAVDLAEEPDRLLAGVLAVPGITEVRLVYVVDDASGQTGARETLEELASAAGRQIDVAVRVGRPADEALAEAADWNATAIAVGPCRHTALQRALQGSVAREVALKAPHSVLFVPPSG